MRVLFFGTPDFAARVLEALLPPPAGGARSRHEVVALVSQPSRPQGRGLRVEDPAAVQVARAARIPVLQPAKLHAPEALASFRGLAPDLCVTAAFGRLLRPALLELAPRGCWNVHASLLPRHRGASPVSAAILAGDAWTGVTIFKLDEGLDTGPTLLQEMTPIGSDETAGELTDRLARIGGRLLAQACDLEERGGLIAQAQPAFGATYASLVDKEDGCLDWNRPVEQVDRAIRAFSPWPGAFTFAAGKRLRVHRSRPWHRLQVFGAEPNTLVAVPEAAPSPLVAVPEVAPGTLVPAPEGIGVVCNPGVLLLLEVQGEGRKRQEAAEWLRGSRLPAGARLRASA
jgi:methionyl-tRNA formyltransferase